MRSLLTIVVMAGTASASLGQEAGLEVKVRFPGGQWTDFVAAGPGQTIECAVFGRHDGPYGFGSAQYEVRGDSLAGVSSGISGLQRVTPFAFGPQTLAVYYEAGGFRLDVVNDPDNQPVGITSVQRDPFTAGAGFSTADPALLLRFDFTAPAAADLYHVRVPFERIRTGRLGVYDSAEVTRPRMTPDISVNGAWIYVGGNPCIGQHYQIAEPVIEVMPGEDVSFTVTGGAAMAQWSRVVGGAAVELVETPRVGGPETATLTLRQVTRDDSGEYRVNVLCETLTATLRVVCPADFNDDRFVDFLDFDAFVACFEGTACPAGVTADFNGDGFTDFMDLDAFIQAFEIGCAG